jgi:hypothetical protein
MAYSSTVKATCKADWETGQFTIAQIAKKRQVPVDVLNKWPSRYKWVKGSTAVIVQEAIERKVIDELSELGMPKRRALEILIEGMTKPEFTQFDGKGDQTIATPCKDYKVIRGYLQDYLKLIDAFPAERQEIDMRVEVRGLIMGVIEVIREYVPGPKLNECIDKIQSKLMEG